MQHKQLYTTPQRIINTFSRRPASAATAAPNPALGITGWTPSALVAESMETLWFTNLATKAWQSCAAPTNASPLFLKLRSK